MNQECTGYWYECDCDDCIYVSNLYAELEYYDNDPEFQYEIDELVKEIESMGYFV